MSTILTALNASSGHDKKDAAPGTQKALSLNEKLVAAGVLPEYLAEAEAGHKRKGDTGFFELLIRKKAIDEIRLLKILSEHFSIPFWPQLPMESINIDFTQNVPIHYLKKHRMVPIITTDFQVIAVNDPVNFQPADDLRLLLQMQDMPVVLASQDAITAAINLAYDMSRSSAKDYFEEISEETADDLISEINETADLLDETSDAPIIKLVNLLVSGAIKDRASDIHVEPYSGTLKIRYRIDGILYDILNLPRRIQSPLTSRLKIMAKLNIAEKRLPQDGRIELKIADRLVDVRVSVIPTAFGERVVLRLLDKSANILMLSDLGMHDERIKLLDSLIKSPYGIILVTGPTGSGKTTTLYAALSTINRPEINIITIEDPIEYQMDGVGQIQVNPKIDLTFAAGLRSIVRQDPDVILVGEIRDRETAEIAIQSSLTGHLVFSTLHTNDAASAVTRLIDMGIEPFLVTSSIVAIIAQRLVRVLCPHCKEVYTPDKETLANLGLTALILENNTFYRKKGCNLCMHTGFRGRTAIFEILVVDDDIKRLVLKTSDANQINEQAIKQGMITLQQDGIHKVLAGITTTEEVLRVTRSLARKEDIVQET
ncbi:MAG TPA: type II secretion system ATPase GspE [Smithellaceae bacterium]|jgi:general secretion pathway protein E|nr:type II secretion system ATPase GspE [Smithella sp.]HQP24199.1 type II secretion system ATPase GspE [Smithellaceae bacterium]HRY34873.1 type II secretion system ATPase GspE [Smithellaceae bacterium]